MEIFLTKQCETLTGSLGKGYGYYIRKAPNKEGSVRFFSQRSKWNVPADGHLRFIFACAQLAQMKTHITDICVSKNEVRDALISARKIDLWANLLHICESCEVKSDFLNADDVVYFKNYCNL